MFNIARTADLNKLSHLSPALQPEMRSCVPIGMESQQPDQIPVLLERLRFVRELREKVDGELEREEFALLTLLRSAGASWRLLAEDEYKLTLNGVQKHYGRLGKRVRERA